MSLISFPSVLSLGKSASETFKRFPLAILSAILGSSLCIYLADFSWNEQKNIEYLWKIVMCCSLGLTLLFSLSLFSERKNHSLIQKYFLQLLGIVLLTVYYFSLPEKINLNFSDIT